MKRSKTGLTARRGTSLLELMIASVVSSMVMGAVAMLMWTSGRAIKTVYGQTRTRSARMRAIDQIRYTLANAEIGSVVEYDAQYEPPPEGSGDPPTLIGYHRIDFTDPTNGAGTSTFFFNSGNDTLFYDADTGDGTPAAAILTGPVDVLFQIEAAELIRIRVKTSSVNTYGGDVDTQDGETLVYLRNIP